MVCIEDGKSFMQKLPDFCLHRFISQLKANKNPGNKEDSSVISGRGCFGNALIGMVCTIKMNRYLGAERKAGRDSGQHIQ